LESRRCGANVRPWGWAACQAQNVWNFPPQCAPVRWVRAGSERGGSACPCNRISATCCPSGGNGSVVCGVLRLGSCPARNRWGGGGGGAWGGRIARLARPWCARRRLVGGKANVVQRMPRTLLAWRCLALQQRPATREREPASPRLPLLRSQRKRSYGALYHV